MPDLPEQLHSRPGTAVATRSAGVPGVPYPVDNDAGLTANDILIPRMKIVQKMSRVFDDELADYGAVYVITSADDMEPTILAPAPAKGDLGKPVRFYALAEPVKGWSWTDPDENLQRGAEYPPLSWVINQNPRKVNRTYRYLLSIPDYPQLPVSFLMYGAWGGNSAKFMNGQIVLARDAGREPWEVAFKLQARKTENTRGGAQQPYVQGIVSLAKVTAKDKASDAETIERHRQLVGQANVTLDDDDTAVSQQADAESTATDVPDLG